MNWVVSQVREMSETLLLVDEIEIWKEIQLENFTAILYKYMDGHFLVLSNRVAMEFYGIQFIDPE